MNATDTDRYLDELADRLRCRAVETERVDELLAELRGHLAESGERPQDAFGPCEHFAADLLAEEAHADPPSATAEDEQRTFRATALDEVEILESIGDDGWELTGVRDFGLHARRPRDPGARRRWEYQRRRAWRGGPLEEQMRAEGWEPCGRWRPFRYFKRPAMRRHDSHGSHTNSSERLLIAGLVALLAALLFGLPLEGTVGVVVVVATTAVALTLFVLSVRSAHRAHE